MVSLGLVAVVAASWSLGSVGARRIVPASAHDADGCEGVVARRMNASASTGREVRRVLEAEEGVEACLRVWRRRRLGVSSSSSRSKKAPFRRHRSASGSRQRGGTGAGAASREAQKRRRPSMAAASAKAHEVRGLPGLPADWDERHYAGMIESDTATEGRLFYWFFEKSRGSSFRSSSPTPLLIWLNGGPGCTSMDGLFLENGPFVLTGPLRLARRKASWHRLAHVLYLDQPVGTGFSWSRQGHFCHDDTCIARHFVTFLRRFARIYASLVMASATRSAPIYFSGESHAGHYVPLLVEALRDDDLIDWDVRGMALGNAWIDPYNQYDASRIGVALGLVRPGDLKSLRAQERTCQLALQHGQYMNKVCWNLLDDVVRLSAAANRDHLKANMYDARESVRSTVSFPPGHDRVEEFMNAAAVRTALHVDPGTLRFHECANPPYNALKHQDGLGVVDALRRILDRGDVNVLFYNGQFDLICNHVGVQRSLLALDWAHADTLRRAKYRPWLRTPDATRPAGHLLEAPRLALLLVTDSGHMVPMNQPDVALDMIQNFIAATETATPLSVVFHAAASRPPDRDLNRSSTCSHVCGSFRDLDPARHLLGNNLSSFRDSLS